LQQLPKLSELHLHQPYLDDDEISAFSQLQRLQHFSLDLTGSYYLVFGSPALQPEALPTALQHLTQRQHLQLYCCELHRVARQPPPSGQQGDGDQLLSALTASTQLTALIVVDKPQPLPQAAFAHMLPAGRMLPLGAAS
jgi:hypothetical protein